MKDLYRRKWKFSSRALIALKLFVYFTHMMPIICKSLSSSVNRLCACSLRLPHVLLFIAIKTATFGYQTLICSQCFMTQCVRLSIWSYPRLMFIVDAWLLEWWWRDEHTQALSIMGQRWPFYGGTFTYKNTCVYTYRLDTYLIYLTFMK